MKAVLVILAKGDDSTQMYYMEEMAESDFNRLNKCNPYFDDMTDAERKLLERFFTAEERECYIGIETYKDGQWAKYKLVQGRFTPVAGEPVHVITLFGF